ncbi:hypothetical protein E3T26_06955 [Cryobacterium sp. TMT1-21]|uniref:hypothetical protein n=1 Tax=Cryobacterium sp. TMT1-21 TaxID=1259234 RepID=UPI001069D849|nr:hypothetical protein [Cryobacterium sp. TMT1-21]TFD15515.1 hypothetical protein E3T26_06955 [Cryobacterium sp. TMT1-21]
MADYLPHIQDTLTETWDRAKREEAFHRLLKLWDKKLSHLNDEMLHYVLMRVTSILNYRAEQERLRDCLDTE